MQHTLKCLVKSMSSEKTIQKFKDYIRLTVIALIFSKFFFSDGDCNNQNSKEVGGNSLMIEHNIS